MSFEIVLEKLVYGGDALGYHQGRAVFVPRALPGECWEVELEREAKGVWHARPLGVVAPSKERVEPPCPYFGGCGGCHYQHLDGARQPEIKRQLLVETLRRIGKIAWKEEIPVHIAAPWNYRNQAEIKVARGSDGGIELGFFEHGSHRLYPVESCAILSPRLNALLGEMKTPAWRERLDACQALDLFADESDERARVIFRGSFSAEEGELLAKMALGSLPGVVSAAVEGAGGRRNFGQTDFTYRVGEFRYRVSPGSFFQASRFLLPELAEVVTSGVTFDAPRLALDLFAGVGLFALPLARRFERVVAVEAEPAAAADLAANARAHGLENLRAIAAPVSEFLRRFAEPPPELVVLDPPRAGVGPNSLRRLLALRPAQIHYLSCHPPTLARDLRLALDGGYALDSVEMFDLFPQTFHIEALARLTAKSNHHY
jgi:23S rRNA (uracil1939-C5)-methyltransferase